MSLYYNQTMVRLLTEERLREARQSNMVTCCMEPEAARPTSSVRTTLRNVFRRQSPAACSC
jgi:hypothetical protein